MKAAEGFLFKTKNLRRRRAFSASPKIGVSGRAIGAGPKRECRPSSSVLCNELRPVKIIVYLMLKR